MKVIFLDFDGVLNSSASFIMETRKSKKVRGMPVNKTLCHVCCSNFQYVLDKTPKVKIVISSTWRENFDLEWLKNKLASYGIDSSRVIDVTSSLYAADSGPYARYSTHRADRGEEVNEWLLRHPEVTKFAVIDDNFIGDGLEQKGVVVKTDWLNGMTINQAREAIVILGGHNDGHGIPT